MPKSGWCGLRGRPDCKRCRVAECECPGCGERLSLSQIPDTLWDNGDSTKDGPARCANTVIAGPRQLAKGAD